MENLNNKTKEELLEIIKAFQSTNDNIDLPELIASMQDFIFVFDEKQYFKFVNIPKSSKLYVNSEMFLGKKHSEVMPEQVTDKFQNVFSENRIGKTGTFEYQLKINNQNFDFFAKMSPLYTKGKFSGSIAIVSDITEQNIVRKALVNEVQFSSKILETSNAVIVGLDKNHIITLFNKGAEKVTGYKAKELIGKDWFKTFFPENILDKMDIVWKNHWGAKHATNINAIRIKSGNEKMISWQATGFYDDEDDNKHFLISIGEDITERQQAEDSLRIERDNMKNIFEAMDDGIYIVNQEFDVEYVNHVLKNDFGDYKNKKCYKYFHDRTEICTWCKNKEVFSGKTVHWEWHSTKNGKTYDLIDTPLRNLDGSISKLEIFRDITHRVEYKKELEKSEQKFRLLAEYTSDWEYWIGTDGKYVYLSPSCKRISGYEPEEFIENPNLLFDIVHPDNKEHIYQHYHDENNKEAPFYKTEFKIISKKGEIRYLEHSCRSVFDEKNNFIGRRGNNRDITEAKNAENKLIESEKRFKTFFQTSPNAISISTVSDGKYIEINDSFMEMVGYTRDEIIGRSFIELGLWPDKVGRDKFIAEFQKNKIVKDMEMGVKLKNKKEITVLVSANTINISNKAHILIINRDISKIKKSEQELKVYRKNLEKLVRKRTEELEAMNEELSEANKKLEEFNELFVGREFRIKELRDKVKEIEQKLKEKV